MLFIALCGPPKSGKSTVQNILWEKWDVKPVDDGRVVRDLVKRAFFLKEDDVSTQDGKKRMYDLSGAGGPQDQWTNRQLLGKLARGLEIEFGPFVVPVLTIKEFCEPSMFNRFSFGSVRRNQGWFYKERGGIVVEVLREAPSGNDFDLYDRDAVDYTIANNGNLKELKEQVVEILEDIVTSHPRTKNETT